MGIFGPNIEKLQDKKDVDGLIAALQNKNAEIRIKAFLALSALNDKKADGELKKLVDDPDSRVKAIAILEYGELKDKSVIENLKTVILEGSTKDKLNMLKFLGTKDINKYPDIPLLLQLALNDKNPQVKEFAISTMGTLKDSHSSVYIVNHLHDKHHKVRIEAIEALAKINFEENMDHIIGCLADHDKDVKKIARQLLTESGNDKALAAINDTAFIQLISDMEVSEHKRLETIQKIAQQKISKGLPLVIKACSDEFKAVRVESAKALGIFGARSTIDCLKMMMEDQFYDVRQEAVRALGKIMNKNDDLECIEKAMKDSNSHVREEASRVFHNIQAGQSSEEE